MSRRGADADTRPIAARHPSRAVMSAGCPGQGPRPTGVGAGESSEPIRHYGMLESRARSRTRNDLLQVFSGDVAGKAMAVVTSLVIVRWSDATGLGVFSLFLALQNVLSQVSELGTGLSIVKRLSSAVPGSSAFARTLRAGALLRAFVFAGLLLPLLAVSYLLRDDGAWSLALRFSVLSTLALSFLTFALAFHQATGRFRVLATLRVGDSGLRLALILLMLATVGFRIELVLGIYFLGPLLVGLIGCASPARHLRGAHATREDVLSLLHFSKWVMVASMAGTFVLQTDVMLLSAFARTAEVGTYGAALRMVVPLQMVAGSIATVLLPRLSSIGEGITREEVYRRSRRWVGLFALGACALGLLAAPIIFRFFPQYLDSVPLFRVLCVGQAAALAAVPSICVLYAEERARTLAWLGAGQLIGNVIAGVAVIPKYGAMGAAVVTTATLVVGAVGAVWLASRRTG